jgi:hypothetical protein
MLHRDTLANQQAVKIAGLPVQSTAMANPETILRGGSETVLVVEVIVEVRSVS